MSQNTHSFFKKQKFFNSRNIVLISLIFIVTVVYLNVFIPSSSPQSISDKYKIKILKRNPKIERSSHAEDAVRVNDQSTPVYQEKLPENATFPELISEVLVPENLASKTIKLAKTTTFPDTTTSKPKTSKKLTPKPTQKSEYHNMPYTEILKTAVKSSSIPDSIKQSTIKQMMMHAWNGYKTYAWGDATLDPVKNTSNKNGWNPFGGSKCGATIIDSLDTLHIMGFQEEYILGRDWLVENFEQTFMSTTGKASVFELTIRYLGGFLAAFYQSGDESMLRMAVVVADGLLPAFETKYSMPWALFSPKSKEHANWGWAARGCGILAELGTLDLEFKSLSHATNNPKYKNLVDNIRNRIKQIPLKTGVYPLYINQKDGNPCTTKSSFGSLGDSFYEYLIKSHAMNKKDESGLKMYEDVLENIETNFVRKTSAGNLYLSEYPGKHTIKMEHLACFTPGMIALGTRYTSDDFANQEKSHWIGLAANLTKSCRLMYERSATGIGGDSGTFIGANDGRAPPKSASLLRPETVESYFYMWRVTKNPVYREWAWDFAKSLEKHAKTESGYSSLHDVNSLVEGNSNKAGNQESFFLAETLKYLYLIFCDDDVISLDDWVFNTEAHPLRIIKQLN